MRLIRVAVFNNFNCTEKEFRQLDKFAAKYPEDIFFINSNIKTPKLENINNHLYKAVITVNPDLYDFSYIRRLENISRDKIAFLRFKYIYGMDTSVIDRLLETYKVVVTLFRFISKESFEKYVPIKYRNRYYFDKSYYRLKSIPKEISKYHICDRLQKGCPKCKLCSLLVANGDYPIYGLNLSSSQTCYHDCPDCFAKIRLSRVFGKMKYDTIYRNGKQKKKE